MQVPDSKFLLGASVPSEMLWTIVEPHRATSLSESKSLGLFAPRPALPRRRCVQRRLPMASEGLR